MKKILLFGFILFLSAGAFAQEEKSNAETPTDTKKDIVVEAKDEASPVKENPSEENELEKSSTQDSQTQTLNVKDATLQGPDMEEPNIEEVEAPKNFFEVEIKKILSSNNGMKIGDVNISFNDIKKIYAKNNYKTIWYNDGALTPDVKKALKFISQAEYNGLDAKQLDAKLIQERLGETTPQKIAENDILITFSVIKMISDLTDGRVTAYDLYIDSYNLSSNKTGSISKRLKEFLETENIDYFIDKYSPKISEYKFLKEELAKIIKERNARTEIFPKIKEGPDILPNARDYRMVDIAKRFGNPSTINMRAKDDKFIYYKELQSKVKDFQKKFGIKQTGVINNKTIQALNIDDNDLIAKIAVNMDRLRWLPYNLEPKRLHLNIAAQKLVAYDEGEEAFRQALIIGRSEKKTALMNTYFKTIVFNPYWHAPKGYTLTSLLPILRENPSYLNSEEFDLIRYKPDWTIEIIDPKTVDFKKVNEKNLNFIVRQQPGKKNALGPMKFSLINNFDIYMHGTSEPWLFSSDSRAQSSGCIRVEDPIKLALFSLEDNTDTPKEKYMSYYEAFNDDKLPKDKLPKQVYVSMNQSLPVYINYQTMFSDENGNLSFADDIYGWDKAMISYYANPKKRAVAVVKAPENIEAKIEEKESAKEIPNDDRAE